MGLLALEAVFIALSIQATYGDDAMFWQRMKLAVTALVPGAWLVFSLIFGRSNYEEMLSRWKWVLVAVVALPYLLISAFSGAVFVGPPIFDSTLTRFIRIGWAGYVFHILCLLGAVMVLMNLERTLRNATGHLRWQVKFMVIGLGALFGFRIYTDSQTILFRVLNTNLELVNVAALLLADGLIFWSLLRMRVFAVKLYLSHTFIYNSFTVLLVGLYFIIVGVVARVTLHAKAAWNLPLTALIVLVAIIGLSVIFLSDRLRIRRKRFISRHFRRPLFDYQKVWSSFTEKTASVTRASELCNPLVRMVSETLEVLSVTIWLFDEQQERLAACGSTMFSEEQAASLGFASGSGQAIAAELEAGDIIDVDATQNEHVRLLAQARPEDFREARIRYCVPLAAAGRLIGVMTVGGKVASDQLTFEELELLKTIADQAAASLLNISLSERLRQAKELEAFQVMSAFFMHDLKNLASKLSLVTQNLPVHFDNQEFRGDALKTISQSVTKIKGMCNRLSLLSEKLEMHTQPRDLNEVVGAMLSSMDGYPGVSITQELEPLPPILIDEEQMQKVLLNLVINARDAIGDGGAITVTTRYREGWAELSVTDTGVGMTRDYIERLLFKPFQTTKKTGMGIGLFHCKTIVEAHGGRIEVESEEGKGTTVRVLLPARGGRGA
jgi:putative PEP-CTERM system histidine kinase